MLKRALTVLLPTAAALIATPALADGNRIGVSFGLHSKDSDTLVAPRLDAQFKISKGFGAQAILPMASLSRGEGGQGTFRMGNPYLGGFWTTNLEVLTLQLGAGITLPIASVPQDDITGALTAVQSYTTAQGLAGLGDFWLYTPNTMALAVPLKAELDLALVEVRGDLTWALLIPTRDGGETQTTLQAGIEALINIPFVGFGARLQSVWVPTRDGDKLQLSVAPLVEAELGPVYVRTMFLINLDSPAGFSFDNSKDKFWGWHLGAGVKF